MTPAGLVANCRDIYIFCPPMMNICWDIKTGRMFCLLNIIPKRLLTTDCSFRLSFMNGQVIGNWDKSEKKKSVDLKYSWFRQVADMDEETLERERQKFGPFFGKIA